MKLEYKVLCIDDKIHLLDEPKERIDEFNDQVGVDVIYLDIPVKPEATENPEDFFFRISSEVEVSFKKNTFDLILVDLHMPGNFDGTDIIANIRENHSFFRPIIFYSDGEPAGSKQAKSDLLQAINNAELSGESIFIVSRDDLASKANKIFGAMHNEEHQINRVRGLLMDSVSEFDAKIIEIIKKENLWNEIPEGSQNKIVTALRKFASKDKKSADDLHKSISSMDINDVQALISSDSRDINTFRKAKLLRVILNYIDRFKDNGSILSDGIKDGDSMIETRNAFAHTTSEALGAEQTPEKCKEIRDILRCQLKNINEICEKI